jgi:hypothetical protein
LSCFAESDREPDLGVNVALVLSNAQEPSEDVCETLTRFRASPGTRSEGILTEPTCNVPDSVDLITALLPTVIRTGVERRLRFDSRCRSFTIVVLHPESMTRSCSSTGVAWRAVAGATAKKV